MMKLRTLPAHHGTHPQPVQRAWLEPNRTRPPGGLPRHYQRAFVVWTNSVTETSEAAKDFSKPYRLSLKCRPS